MGTVLGWIVGAHFVIRPVCRAGPYTSDEYLEARFGPMARATRKLVQVQCRTLVTEMIPTPMYLVLCAAGGTESHARCAVTGVEMLATSYTALDGLRSVGARRRPPAVVRLLRVSRVHPVLCPAPGSTSTPDSTRASSTPVRRTSRPLSL